MDKLMWAKRGSWHRLWHRVGIRYWGGGRSSVSQGTVRWNVLPGQAQGKGLRGRPSPAGRGDTGMKAFVHLLVFFTKLLDGSVTDRKIRSIELMYVRKVNPPSRSGNGTF